jgi:hypothetical protein
MSRQPLSIGGGTGRSHFRELTNADLASFNCSVWFLEVASSVEVKDLLDPSTWGVQRRIMRGDQAVVLREDGGFYALLVCVRSAAGFPTWAPFFVHEQKAAIPARGVQEDGAQYRPGRGWVGLAAGKIVADGATKAEVEAILAEMG